MENPENQADLRNRTLKYLSGRRDSRIFSLKRVARIALRSLCHQKGKLVAALAGVSFSATLVFAQIGIYVGFLQACSGLISHAGGDVWVMARGTPALDFTRPLPESTRGVIASLSCVRSVRGLLTSFVPVRQAAGANVNTFMVGIEPSQVVLPWSLEIGLPSDLHAPLSVAVDRADVQRLGLPPNPLGSELRVNREEARVVAVTSGIRSFTLSPYLFAEIGNVRRFADVSDGASSYWLVDVKDKPCVQEVIDRVQKNPELQAWSAREFREKTESYWVTGSGAGVALGFSTALSIVVGGIIVAQTLYTIAKDHERELAGLKAMGATKSDLIAFVQVQAAALALVGVIVGFVGSMAAAQIAMSFRLAIILSAEVLLVGTLAIIGMCVVATIASARVVLKVDPCAVFR